MKVWAAPAQLLFCAHEFSAGAAAWTCWGAGAGSEEPPPKKPPMAWPMEEPTATPLFRESFCQRSGLGSCLPRAATFGSVEGRCACEELTQQCWPSGRRDRGPAEPARPAEQEQPGEEQPSS